MFNYNQRWQLWELCLAEEFLPRKSEWKFPAQKKSQLLLSGAAAAFLDAWNEVLGLCGLCHWWGKEHAFNSKAYSSGCTATLRFSKGSFPETKCLPHTRSLLRTYFAIVSPRLIAFIHFSLLSLVNSSSKVDLFCITDGIRSNPIPLSEMRLKNLLCSETSRLFYKINLISRSLSPFSVSRSGLSHFKYIIWSYCSIICHLSQKVNRKSINAE